MQRVTVVCVGKLKERFYAEAAAEYVKRLGRYCRLELVELPEQRLPENPSPAEIERALAREAEAIRAKLPRETAVTALPLMFYSMIKAPLFVVLPALQDLESPVDLLQQHHPGQMVGKGHGGHAQPQPGRSLHRRMESVGPADRPNSRPFSAILRYGFCTAPSRGRAECNCA